MNKSLKKEEIKIFYLRVPTKYTELSSTST